MTTNANNAAPALELYKKYRPQTWDGIVGQDRITKPFKKAVVAGRVPPAMGFFGPAGCGKTTVAKILAKALNCETRAEDDPNPCNECDTCLAIDANEQMGVTYISMANHHGVDNVREVVKKAWLNQPVKRQVWILDEVHNLSGPAFDALLIPLENEHMPSTFIMCSTAINKIPKTVLSRMSSRQFMSATPDVLAPLLESIAEKEGLEYEDSDVQGAIMNGAGSIRDTIMNFETILETGASQISHVTSVIQGLAEKDTAATLSAITRAESEGFAPRDLVESTIAGLRNLLLAISGVDRDLYGILPVPNPKEVAIALAGKKGLIYTIDELGNSLFSVGKGTEPRLAFDLSVIKIINRLQKSTGGK